LRYNDARNNIREGVYMTFSNEDIAKLYVAYFNRAPDASGLIYWTQNSGLNSLDEIAHSFADQEETHNKYPDTLTDAEFVNTIYNNLFGRDAEKAGLDYWVEQLKKGNVDRPHMIEAVTYGAQDGDEGNDKTILENKTKVALYYAVEKALEGAEFDLSKVTDDEQSVTDAEAEIDELAPQTLELTTGSDELTGGPSGDTFVAVASALSSEKTLQGGDKLDGGDGEDTLQIKASTDFGGMSSGYVKNIEVVDISNKKSTLLDFSVKGMESLETIKADTGDKDLNIRNIGNEGVNVDIRNADEAKTVMAIFEPTLNGDTNDSMTFTLEDVGTPKVGSVDEKDLQLKASGIEKLALVSNGSANYIKADIGNSKEIDASGAGNLNIAKVDTTLETLDASKLEGSLGANLTNATTVKSVSTAKGDDSVTVKNISGNATIDMGEGSDTLSFAGSSPATLSPKVDGVETLGFGSLAGALIYDGSNTSGVEKVKVTNGLKSNLSMVDMGLKSVDIEFTNTKTGTLATPKKLLRYSDESDVTISMYNNKSVDEIYHDDITLDNAKTLKIETKSGKTKYDGTINANAATSVTIDAIEGFDYRGTGAFGTLNVNKVEEMKIKAYGAVNIAGAAAATGIASMSSSVNVDASAVYGNFTLKLANNASGNAVVDVVGAKSNANTITVGTGHNNIKINGGSANDTVNVMQHFTKQDAVSLEFDLDGGNDTVDFDSAANPTVDISNGSTVFKGVENINVGTGTITMNASSISGQAINFTAGGVTLKGTAGSDTIDLTKITGGTPHDIYAGNGADTIKLHKTAAIVDKIHIDSPFSGADTIQDFKAATSVDKVIIDLKPGTAPNSALGGVNTVNTKLFVDAAGGAVNLKMIGFNIGGPNIAKVTTKNISATAGSAFTDPAQGFISGKNLKVVTLTGGTQKLRITNCVNGVDKTFALTLSPTANSPKKITGLFFFYDKDDHKLVEYNLKGTDYTANSKDRISLRSTHTVVDLTGTSNTLALGDVLIM
jgi:hypothetical protein